MTPTERLSLACSAVRRAVPVLPLLALAACVVHRPVERPEPAPAPSLSTAAAVAAGDTTAAVAVDAAWRPFGTSVEGRSLRRREVGHGRKRVLFIGGIHGDERQGSVAVQELPAAFEAQEGLADAITLVLIEDINPDGSAAETRSNANGVDLNRNFPAANFRPTPRTGRHALDQPEARALHRVLQSGGFELVLVAHAATNGPFINWDGPAEGLAQRFAAASGWPIVESENLHDTPGSLGSWVGRDLGIPILTIEYPRGSDPGEGWKQTKPAILAVLQAAAGEESVPVTGAQR